MTTKAGARNAKADRDRIRRARARAREIVDITVELEPQDDDDPEDEGDSVEQDAKLDGASKLKTAPRIDDTGDSDVTPLQENERLSKGPFLLQGMVKALGTDDDSEWRLQVLGNPFGGPENGKDAHGEFFSPITKFHEDRYGLPPVVHYHGFDPTTNKPFGVPAYIGKTVRREVKPDGVWYEVILDKTSAFAKSVWEAAKKGIAKASSGTSHLSRIAKDGHILEWPVVELSIWGVTSTKNRPANAYAVALPITKSVYQAAGLQLPDELVEPPLGESVEVGGPDGQGTETDSKATETEAKTKSLKGGHKMSITPEELAELTKQVADSIRAEQAAASEAEAAIQTRIKAAVDEAVKDKEAELVKHGRLPFSGTDAPTHLKNSGRFGRYDNLDPDDHAFMVAVMQDATRKGISEHGLGEDAIPALAVKMAEAPDDNPVYRATKSAMKAAGINLTKANELNHSTQTGYGDEWIGVAYSSRLWEAIRTTSNIVARIPTIEVPQGTESINIPLDGAAPTFYRVAQATAQTTNTLGAVTNTHTSSKMATAKQALTVDKIGARTIWSGELEEDSLINWVAQLRASMEAEALSILESLVIDGDTDATATTNINDIGGTPAATDYFLAMNGFRKLALITNTANSRSAGASFDVLDFLETVKMLGMAGKNALAKGAVTLLIDPHTHWKSLELTELKTQDVFARPTIENGELTNIYGYGVTVTPNMHRPNQDAPYGLKANSAGKLDLDTAANNTYGAILAVRWDQWFLGWKRRIRFETVRVPQADATEIVCNMRLGMINRDNEASAITYAVPLT